MTPLKKQKLAPVRNKLVTVSSPSAPKEPVQKKLVTVNSPLAPTVPVRKKLVTVSSLSSPKCAYPFCSLSIPVKECKKG